LIYLYRNSMKNSNQEENDLSFPQKIHKIRHLKDFRRIIKEGKNFQTPFGNIKLLKNELNILRIAISISKKFNKKSTKRNKLKRIISEKFRLNKHYLKGFDIWIKITTNYQVEEILKFIDKFIENLKNNSKD